MKTTSRIHRKNKPQTKALQGEKPTIPGQNAAAAGHWGRKFPDKINPLVLHEPKNVEAIKLISEWENIPVSDLCDAWIRVGIESSHSIAFVHSTERDGDEKANALKFLPRLNALLGPPKMGRLPRPCINGAEELDNAITAGKAFIQLLFEVIEHTNNTSFTSNNGHLAAGLQELMWKVQARLQTAADGLQIGYR
jgi:hypothetical protein